MQVGKLEPKGTSPGQYKKQGKALVPVALKEHELCDACHATPAKFKATHEVHSPLYFCGHHYKKHRIYLLMHHYHVEEL